MALTKKAAEKAKIARKRSGKVKTINLALQGGGSHGAFTWGVLERFLDEESIEVEAISGASAGSINAAIYAYGMETGGREKTKDLLEAFWRKISAAAAMSPLQPTFMEKMMGNTNFSMNPSFYAMDYMTRMFSPYQFNVLDLNPLRDIVNELIDFQRMRKCNEVKLFINATNVRNGKIKVFNHSELTADMLLASACLPFLFKTVEVNGEYYWDGGYSGNPALYPLIYNCGCRDIVIIQINPINIEEVPTSSQEILDRVNEISFNATLMREVRAIAFVTKLLDEKKLKPNEYKRMLLHMVQAEDIMVGLGHNSKFNADWDFLLHLKEIGYQAADDWINENYDKIGKESSIDIQKMFLD